MRFRFGNIGVNCDVRGLSRLFNCLFVYDSHLSCELYAHNFHSGPTMRSIRLHWESEKADSSVSTHTSVRK